VLARAQLARSRGHGEAGERERQRQEVQRRGEALPRGAGERHVGVVFDVRHAPRAAGVAGDQRVEVAARQVVRCDRGVREQEAEQHAEARAAVPGAARVASRSAQRVDQRRHQHDPRRLLEQRRRPAQRPAHEPCPEDHGRRDRLALAAESGGVGEQHGADLGQQGPGDVVGVHAVEVGVVEGEEGGGEDGGEGPPQAPREGGDEGERGEADEVGEQLEAGDVASFGAGEQGGEVEAAGGLELDAVDVGQGAAAQEHRVVEDAADVVRGEATLREARPADRRGERGDHREGGHCADPRGDPASVALLHGRSIRRERGLAR
jgi:hypothetical protein